MLSSNQLFQVTWIEYKSAESASVWINSRFLISFAADV